VSRTRRINSSTRKSLIKLSAGLSKLTAKIEGLYKIIEAEEAEIKKTSEKRVKIAQGRMLRKLREMKEERKFLKVVSKSTANHFQGPAETGRKIRKNGWTDEQLTTLRDGLAVGRTMEEMANELGRKISGVRQKAFQIGIRLREIRKTLPKKTLALRGGARGRRKKVIEVKPFEPEEIRTILGLLGSGMPLKEVAIKTGRPFQFIRQRLELDGITLQDIREGKIPKDTMQEDDGRSGVERFFDAIGDDSEETGKEPSESQRELSESTSERNWQPT